MKALIMGCSKSPVGRTLELEPWFLPRFPVHFFPSGFYGQVFSGLRLTAFISVLSGSSALPDFLEFCFVF